MLFINYRIIEFSTALALGILCSEWLAFPWEALLLAIILSWLLMFYRYHLERNRFQTSITFPIASFLFFFLIGLGNTSSEYGIYKSEPREVIGPLKRQTIWVVQIEEIGKPNASYLKYIGRIQKPGNSEISERISLSIKKDCTLSRYHINDTLLVYGELKKILLGPNPYQFNFPKYMARKGIRYAMTIEPTDILYIKEGSGSIRKWAELLRSMLINKLGETPLKKEVVSIAQALTLGDRSDIDTDLYDSYSKAGAVHILAVSGLHVGIVMLLFNQLFSFLLRFPNGRILRTVIVVVLLWAFALLSGFSPSVVRAVGMFSFFCFGKMTDRPTHGINTLFLAFFITVLLAPQWLFQPGFQMSYLAVGSILLLQPQFQKLWYPKFWGVRKIWEIFTVSLAAQLGVAPIGLYYFHQFPGLFWLTNWVLLPFLAFVLLYSFIILLLSNFQNVPLVIYEVYNTLIHAMNAFVRWISNQESFLWKTGAVSILTVILAYVLIALFVRSDRTFAKRVLFLVLGLCLLSQAVTLRRLWTPEQQLIWFHLWGENCFAIETKNQIQIFSTRTHQEEEYPVKNYLALRNKPFESRDTIPKIFKIEKTTLVVIDSLGIYPNIQDAVVVLTHNPKMHIERMLDKLKPILVLADGSNYRLNVQRWKEECKKRETPLWATEEAAYVHPLARKSP